MAAPLRHRASQLTIHLGTRDRAGHRSLVAELVHRARRANLAGATVLQGLAGYGNRGVLERHHLMGGSAPIRLVVVDDRQRIDRFLAELGPLLDDLLVTVRDVEVVDQ